MADDDNFDIDIYGDESADYVQAQPDQVTEHDHHDDPSFEPAHSGANHGRQPNEPATERQIDGQEQIDWDDNDGNNYAKEQDTETNFQAGSYQEQEQERQSLQPDVSDGLESESLNQVSHQQQIDRPEELHYNVEPDPGATSALRLGELQWWITEDDIRGWANQCIVEEEVKEITFNEHKVNGKSKGEVYVELESPRAATAMKRQIDLVASSQQMGKKATIIYINPGSNPFKTYPKDAPARRDNFKDRQPGAYAPNLTQGGGFKGGRGNFNNRGNFNAGTFNHGSQGRGAFSSSAMPMISGYNGMNNASMGMGMGMNPQMGGFGGQMGGFNRGGGMMGINRGGFQGNRGGRGGMMNNMGNMGAMPNMGMGMGGNYPQGQFNNGYYGNGSSGQMSAGNPHGTKRQREG